MANMTVKPWAGEPGYLCCPRPETLPAWPEGAETVTCPECGAGCYLMPRAEELLKANPQLKIACTPCALRLGAEVGENRA